jgi:chromosome segregation ATPase
MLTRKSVTRDDVFRIAQRLVNDGLMPTQAKVRGELGFGSMHTIHNYLQEWKKKCFAANNTAPLLQEELTSVVLELNDLEKESKQFNKIRQHLQQQVDNLTISLKTAENKASKFEFQVETLQAELAIQAAENDTLLTQYHNCQDILKEREKNLELFIKDKNELIDKLHQEMKETSKQAIEEAREYNHKQHDALLKYQVENMNLQNELKTLVKKVKEQEEQLLSLKLSIIPLKKELQEKEAIINTYVTKEELETYVRGC